MANIKQAKKRVRRNDNRAEINQARRGRVRTFVKKVETAIEAGDKETATEAFRAAQPEIARGVNKGILHKNTAARRIAGLARRVKNIGA